MGKKRSKRAAPSVPPGSHSSITLREETKGKRQINVNAKSMLKLEHVRNLAIWAGGEASIPSLGAFFGQRLAALGEVLGSQPDQTLFACRRCETILQPGYNCSIRIEKNAAKSKRRCKKTNTPPQNYVIYKCRFCSYRNLKRGTPQGHMKEICPPEAKPSKELEPSKASPNPVNSDEAAKGNVEAKPSKELEPSKVFPNPDNSKEGAKSNVEAKTSKKFEPSKVFPNPVNSEEGEKSNVEARPLDEIAFPTVTTDDAFRDSPATPSVKTVTTLLEAKRRKRNRSGSNKAVEPESSSAVSEADKSIGTSNKRKRKSWTTLKEIAESSERGNKRNITNLTIPFDI
ncbi:hypothetical protein NMG60_11027104 [Bertholletia excelsa]